MAFDKVADISEIVRVMLRLFIALSFETNFGSWLNINHTFLYSFLCSHWFGCITNWPLDELQLDAQYQIKVSPHVINGLCHNWSNSWDNLPTYNTWKYFAANWIPTFICFVLAIAFHLLGFAKLFFCDSLLSLLCLVTNILESASAQLL